MQENFRSRKRQIVKGVKVNREVKKGQAKKFSYKRHTFRKIASLREHLINLFLNKHYHFVT